MLTRRDFIRASMVPAVVVAQTALRRNPAVHGFMQVPALSLGSSEVLHALMTGPHRAAIVPLYVAFTETVAELEKLRTGAESLTAFRSRVSEVTALSRQQLEASLRRALASGIDPVLVMPAGTPATRDLALSFVGKGSLPPLGGVTIDALTRQALNDALSRLIANPGIAKLRFSYNLAEPHLNDLLAAAKGNISLPSAIQRVLSERSQVRGLDEGVLGIIENGLRQIHELGLRSMAALGDARTRIEQQVGAITAQIEQIVTRIQSAWNALDGARRSGVLAGGVPDALNGAASAVAALAPLLGIAPEDARRIGDGLKTAALVVGGLITANPLMILGAMGSLLDGLFGGSADEERQQQALQQLGTMVANLHNEMRLQFDDLRQRLAGIDARLVAMQQSIGALSSQLDLVRQELSTRLDEIRDLLVANAAVDLQSRWNALDTAIDTYNEYYPAYRIGALSGDPVTPVEIGLARNAIRGETKELLSRFAPGAAGLGHPAFAGSLRLDATIQAWAATRTTSRVLATYAELTGRNLQHPLYGGRNGIETAPAGANFVTDVLDLVYKQLPSAPVNAQNEQRFQILPGSIAGGRFTPRPLAPRACPMDVYAYGNRLAAALADIKDVDLAAPLKDQLTAVLLEHVQGLQLLNSADGLTLLLSAFNRLLRDLFRDVDELFHNPYMTALRRAADAPGLRVFRSSPAFIASRFGGIPVPLSKFYSGTPPSPAAVNVNTSDYSKLLATERGSARGRLEGDIKRTDSERQAMLQPVSLLPVEQRIRDALGLGGSVQMNIDAYTAPIDAIFSETNGLLREVHQTMADWASRAAAAPFKQAEGRIVPDFSVADLQIEQRFRGWYDRAATITNARLPALEANLDQVLQRLSDRSSLTIRCHRVVRSGFALRVLAEALDIRRRESRRAAVPDGTPRFVEAIDTSLAAYFQAALRGVRADRQTEFFVECVFPRLDVTTQPRPTEPRNDTVYLLVGPREARYDAGGALAIWPARLEEVTATVQPFVLQQVRLEPGGRPVPIDSATQAPRAISGPWDSDLTLWFSEVSRAVANNDVCLATSNPIAPSVGRLYGTLRTDGETRTIAKAVMPRLTNSLDAAAFQRVLEDAITSLYTPT